MEAKWLFYSLLALHCKNSSYRRWQESDKRSGSTAIADAYLKDHLSRPPVAKLLQVGSIVAAEHEQSRKIQDDHSDDGQKSSSGFENRYEA